MENESKIQNQLVRARQDTTKKTPAHNRRLDTIARLISSESICVAVSIIKGKLYIAANELSKDHSSDRATTSEKNIVAAIGKIAGYFKKVATDKKIPSYEERKVIFLEICSETRIKNSQKISIPNGLCKKIGEEIFNGKIFNISDTVSLASQYQADPTLVVSIYTEFSTLYEDFQKLEKTLSIQDNNKVTDEQLKAFKSDYQIVANDNRGGSHAEVQILSEIANKKLLANNPVYIGISKLCCLHCHAMLETANKVFKERNFSISDNYIQIRGWHDLDFDWTPPGLFYNGYNKKKLDKKREECEIVDLIGYDTRISVTPLLKERKPQTYMRASKSDSEAEELSLKFFEEKNKFCGEQLNILKEFADDPSARGMKNMYLIATELYKNEQFTLIPAQKPKEQERMNIFASISGGIKEKISGITDQSILAVLKNPFFVGEDIAKHFKEFKLSEEIKYEKEEEYEMEITVPKQHQFSKPNSNITNQQELEAERIETARQQAEALKKSPEHKFTHQEIESNKRKRKEDKEQQTSTSNTQEFIQEDEFLEQEFDPSKSEEEEEGLHQGKSKKTKKK